MKPSRASVRARDAATERSIQAAVRSEADVVRAQFAQAKAEYAERNKPVPFTREELEAASHVRFTFGWRAIVKVNAKSVKIVEDATNPALDRLVRIEKILEVRA